MLIKPDRLSTSASNMPPASSLWLLNKGLYVVRFEINGYFSTSKGVAYFNDATARFIETFGNEAVKPSFCPNSEPDYQSDTVLHLKDFTANLVSLKSKIANKAPLNVESLDETFWCMKLWLERQLSQNRIPSIRELEAIGANYSPHKERSTIRAKARSIYRWYADRNFGPTSYSRTKEDRRIQDHQKYLKLTNKKEEEIMTRQEAARVATQTRMARVQAKIEQAINLLKMENRKITVRAVAEFAQTSTSTSAKYLKILREKGAI